MVLVVGSCHVLGEIIKSPDTDWVASHSPDPATYQNQNMGHNELSLNKTLLSVFLPGA